MDKRSEELQTSPFHHLQEASRKETLRLRRRKLPQHPMEPLRLRRRRLRLSKEMNKEELFSVNSISKTR